MVTSTTLYITIDDKRFATSDGDQTAAALLRLAGRDPKIFDLFLIAKNGVEEKIKDGQIINLKDGHRFRSRQQVRFTVDGEPFRTYDEDQTAADLLRLAGMDPAGYDLARVGAPASFPDNEIVVIVDRDEFVTAKHVGGVA
ncbi:multiubiquitin domain-containing protein [Pseudoclavibacter helvolus]|uniref:multiubiquitin domain-containing protein n=1 Tax=Pseudoclavibacter helvolus TaxID=255205 RepID=UPI0008388364|nr:multiubiquitin domain-containing protein [Pseudoclavibacter helvolus]